MTKSIKKSLPTRTTPQPAEPVHEPAPNGKAVPRLRLEPLEKRLAPGIDTTPSFRLP